MERASGRGEEEERRKHRKIGGGEEGEASLSVVDPAKYARSYQLEALEMALRQNTIAFLETGSGKTLIAIMLLRACAHALRKPSDNVAVFLVPTVVLVSQQADVVEMHTDLRVGRFWGEMGVDFWNAATWKEKMQQFEVLVMTPQILLDNLRHSFFTLEKIKLLIFDECHHGRGRHPYACIMTEFYHRRLKVDSMDLPRIFGMTASLVNSKACGADYGKRIIELETVLNSKVFTVSSESVLAQYIPFSTTRIKLYDAVDLPYSVAQSFSNRLKSIQNKHLEELQDLKLENSTEESARKKILRLCATFSYCLMELGVWLAAKAAESLSCKEHNIFLWGEKKDVVAEETARKFCQDVSLVFSHYIPSGWCIGSNLKRDVDDGLLTAKVQSLIESLVDYRRIKDLRCIIFVERVITSIVLQSLLCKIKELSGWGIERMAGTQSGLQSQTRKEQMKIVDAFREGKVNVVVATQILEEGLDVQSCNLVIRFDPSVTVRSFIQSRGRARMQGSDYLLILKGGDSCSLSKVANYLRSGDIMREESLRQASIPCQPLKSGICDEDYYSVATTGAIVTMSSSIALLYFYCSKLPSDGYYKPTPRFIYDKESSSCMLVLPKNCPLQSIRVSGRSDMLKRMACLEACRKLHEIGALTDQLLPVADVAIEDEVLEGDEPFNDEHAEYFPGELVDSWSNFSTRGLYYCYKITLNQSFNYVTSFSDIFLVVNSELGPDFVSSSFCLQASRGSVAVSLKFIGAIHLSSDQVFMGKRFQSSILCLLIHHDLKNFMDAKNNLHQEISSSTVTYLLLPSIGGKVDWHCVKFNSFSAGIVGGRHTEHCCSSEGVVRQVQTQGGVVCSCMLHNCLVYTPHNGHFYHVSGLHNNLDGNSTIRVKRNEVLTYKDYYISRHGIHLACENESLLAGRHLFTVQNFLLRRAFQKEKEFSNGEVELPPELCMVIMQPVSASILYSFSFAPSIMHRIQSLLLAARLKSIQAVHCGQNTALPAALILEAITARRCQEEFCLESLETLGDSFLKYAVSQHLFRSCKYDHEGILSAKKEKMISNASLSRLGCGHYLPGFIRTEQFDPNHWGIPGYCGDDYKQSIASSMKGGGTYNKGTRYMKRKVIADSVEAIIGAYLRSSGELAAFSFLQWLGVKVEFSKQLPIDSLTLPKPEMYVNVNALESLLEYTFRNPSLLVEALTHGSYQLPNIPNCYQRLEFLGDAVLDHLITVHLYKEYPGITPGLLTDLRSASVNNNCYAHAAVKAGLGKHIIHASPELHNQMTFHLTNFANRLSGSSYGWDAGAALPKVLGDIVESIAGAIYVDSGFNMEIVWKSIKPLLEPMVRPETIEYHPVRELEELCSRKSYVKTFTTSEDGVPLVTAQVEADGVVYKASSTGPNRKTAKRLAAKAVLQSLKESNPGLQKPLAW